MFLFQIYFGVLFASSLALALALASLRLNENILLLLLLLLHLHLPNSFHSGTPEHSVSSSSSSSSYLFLLLAIRVPFLSFGHPRSFSSFIPIWCDVVIRSVPSSSIQKHWATSLWPQTAAAASAAVAAAASLLLFPNGSLTFDLHEKKDADERRPPKQQRPTN
jgi:hypothetical protein